MTWTPRGLCWQPIDNKGYREGIPQEYNPLTVPKPYLSRQGHR